MTTKFKKLWLCMSLLFAYAPITVAMEEVDINDLDILDKDILEEGIVLSKAGVVLETCLIDIQLDEMKRQLKKFQWDSQYQALRCKGEQAQLLRCLFSRKVNQAILEQSAVVCEAQESVQDCWEKVKSNNWIENGNLELDSAMIELSERLQENREGIKIAFLELNADLLDLELDNARLEFERNQLARKNSTLHNSIKLKKACHALEMTVKDRLHQEALAAQVEAQEKILNQCQIDKYLETKSHQQKIDKLHSFYADKSSNQSNPKQDESWSSYLYSCGKLCCDFSMGAILYVGASKKDYWDWGGSSLPCIGLNAYGEATINIVAPLPTPILNFLISHENIRKNRHVRTGILLVRIGGALIAGKIIIDTALYCGKQVREYFKTDKK